MQEQTPDTLQHDPEGLLKQTPVRHLPEGATCRVERRRFRAIFRRVQRLGARARAGKALSKKDLLFLRRYGVDPTQPTTPKETPHDD